MNDGAAIGAENPAGLRWFAIMIGLALPIQVMGRAAIAGALIVAFLCFLSLPGKSFYLKRAFAAARGPIGLMGLVTLILWLPNTLQSIYPLRSLEAGVRTFVYVGIAALFWAVMIENKRIHALSLRSLVVASTVAVIIAITAETALPGLYWLLHFRGWLSLPLGSSLKPFASLAVFMIPALIWAGARLGGVWVILAAGNLIGFLALVWLTYNRATISGLLGMAALAAGLAAWSSRSRLIKVALPVGAIVAFVSVLIWLHMTRQRPGFGGDWMFPLWLVDFQRQMIWRFAFKLVEQNFWFGLGINTINFAPGANAIIPHTADKLTMIPSHPHNWMLEVAAETGIFGLLSLLAAIALSFIRDFRGFIRNHDYAYFVTACMAVGYWSSGLFNFSFWSSWWQISFLLMTALFLSQRSEPVSAGRKRAVY